MKTYKISVTGRVQGVGFRAYIQEVAKKNDLKGSVQNLENGQVEIILQGSENDLIEMKQNINSPTHPFIKVTQVEVQELPTQKTYTAFNIIY